MKISISKHYEEQVLFDHLQMKLTNHKINVILGPSGCGKTTLLQAIAGLTTFEGEITDASNSNVSYVFQEDRLFPYLTVRKNLLIIHPNEEEVDEYLKKFNLYSIRNHYPNQMSGGEKQRISIIRAFLTQAPIMLMDEPFKSLDLDLKLKLIEEVLLMQKEFKTTIILVTHDLDVALYLGHAIHMLSNKIARVTHSFNNNYQGQFETDGQLRVKIQQILLGKV
jgi:NitT/TauT family transport system ATP-binding protein